MLGNLFAAGASLLGGVLGKKSSDDARASTEALTRENMAQQREFAQHGIRWRVEDAKAAGIHPIYALGGNTASFTPVSANFAADTSLPNAFAAAGQDVGRAINATRTQSERATAFSRTAQALQLENMSLQNDVLRTEIASKTGRLRSATNPPFPGDAYLIPGQTESGSAVVNSPLTRTAPNPAATSNEPGAITDTGYARTAAGGYVPLPSKDVKERIEDVAPHEWNHFWRNNILPLIAGGNNPPFRAPPGQEWTYDLANGYRLVPNRSEKYRRDMRRFTPSKRGKDFLGRYSTNF